MRSCFLFSSSFLSLLPYKYIRTDKARIRSESESVVEYELVKTWEPEHGLGEGKGVEQAHMYIERHEGVEEALAASWTPLLPITESIR